MLTGKDKEDLLQAYKDIDILLRENLQLKSDADIMFNALFSIISDNKIYNLEKCMEVANDAINNIADKTRHNTRRI